MATVIFSIASLNFYFDISIAGRLSLVVYAVSGALLNAAFYDLLYILESCAKVMGEINKDAKKSPAKEKHQKRYTLLGLGDSITEGNGEHYCALMDTGRIKCWGANDYGQLGYEDSEDRGDLGSQQSEIHSGKARAKRHHRHEALQDAVFTQGGVSGRRAFIVDGQRAAPLIDRAIVNHRDPRRRHAFAQEPGKG